MSNPPPPLPRSPLSPVYTGDPHAGRLAPPGWLDHAPVTRGLIALNVCAFLIEVAFAHGVSELPVDVGLTLGASYSLATLHEGRVETLVTACFLHSGVVHLLFNMVALWQGGPLVERAVGSARMAPMYLLAGVVGNALSVAYGGYTHVAGMTVGASGAIAGVIGAAIVVYWRIGGWRDPTTQAMARWLALVIGFGFFMNVSGQRIDNAAHIGGAIIGAAMAALWRRDAHYSPATTRITLAGCGGVIALCAALVAIRDRADPFASMELHDRIEYTSDALTAGRCTDAQAGLRAVERLHTRLATGNDLRRDVEMVCPDTPDP